MNRLAKIAAFALCIALFGSTSPQAGEPGTSEEHLSVSYGDLDLTGRAGIDALLSRIKAAADQACGGTPDVHDLAARVHHRTCTKAAMDDAVSHLGLPMVSAVYGGPAQVAVKQ